MKNYDDKIILLDLANAIKLLRLQKSLTQAECYTDTGINFGRIERGVRNISFTTFLKICSYFKISPEEFFVNFFKDSQSQE